MKKEALGPEKERATYFRFRCGGEEKKKERNKNQPVLYICTHIHTYIHTFILEGGKKAFSYRYQKHDEWAETR